ncbi:MarC family protein [Neisseria sp. Ec49-e6-T10]|uniref:MarC family protein n=1 Tax=Neisseria sp. Ec49-e6-T10 TaxID=3140744 RepID=UPI003EB929AB
MEIIKIMIALLVLMNPLGAISLFIGLTPGYSQEERKKIAKTSFITIIIVVFFFSLLGESILHFLNISIGSFRVGGGILVMLIAISLMNPKPTDTKTTQEEKDEAENKSNIAVVPLTIPLQIGPGTISTIIIYSSAAKTGWQTIQLLVAGCIAAMISYSALVMATPISKILGQTGINIVNRLMGMVLAAVSIEIIVAGLKNLFPTLL